MVGSPRIGPARIGPSRIGRYNILRRVGAGGMGVVYEAHDSRTDERLALKVLLPHAAEESDGLLRFKREFRALARLRHPNVVRVLDAGIENDVPFIAMEFLDGRDVRTHVKSQPDGVARDKELRHCLRQIFGALAHVHARRIVHRDLKPENVIVCSDGRVKLMDFGVARVQQTSSHSGPGLLGTFAYMAPEQVLGRPVDGRSDLYAVGILLYEILTGAFPFPVAPPAAALHHHVNSTPEHVLKVAPDSDPALAALTHRLLEKDPLDRLQSAEEAFRYLDGDDTAPVDLSLPGQLFAPRFVARFEEMTVLGEFVDDLIEGRGRLLALHGPSGIGKSRLVQELLYKVGERAVVLQGQCAAERSQHVYYPFQTIFDEVEAIARRGLQELAQRIVGPDAALLQSVSPRLARLGGPARAEHFDAAERKVRLHKAMVGVIGRLALTQPVLVVLEDVHWSDPGTLEMIWDISRTLLTARPRGAAGETVCPVGLILTRRSLSEGPDASEALVRRLKERNGFEALGVGPIPEEGVRAMLRTMTGVQEPTSEVVEELVRTARGRPVMVQEVLESWVSDRTLERQRGIWHFRGRPLEVTQKETSGTTGEDNDEPTLSGAHAVPPVPDLPAGTDDVVQARLGHLSTGARMLIERLALLGRGLPANLVAALTEGDEESFLDAIDELVRARLLLEEVDRQRVRYRFQHDDFRAAVVRSLPAERKAALHAFIATRIEDRFRRRRSELAPMLARHFSAAGQGARAVRYLSRMAQRASEQGDLDGALRRLDRATRILDERPRTRATATRRLRLLMQQIDLLLDFGRASEALDRADPQAGLTARNPELMSAELNLRRAAAQFSLGELDAALATLANMPSRSPTRSLAARYLRLEGRARLQRRDYVQARAVLQAACDLAKDAGLDDLAHELDREIAVVLTHEGEYEGALGRLERGLRHARSQRDARAIGHLLGQIGLVHAARGESEEAESRLTEAVDVAQSLGHSEAVLRWSGELGRILMDRGDVESAVAHLKDTVDRAADHSDRASEAGWRRELGAAYLAAGHIERAASELSRALSLTTVHRLTASEAQVRISLSALALERGYDQVDEALDQANRALELARSPPCGGDILGSALLQLGRVRRAQGDVTQARETFEQARAIAESIREARLLSRVHEALSSLPAILEGP